MIREATVSDASRIAEINVASWRFAYKGIVPEEYLYKDFLVENRIAVSRRWITEKRFEVYVYEDPATGIVKGMMGIGKCGDADKSDAFELHFLYVEPDYSRAGIGSEMIRFFEEKGAEKGFGEYVIWVLEDNEIGKRCYQKNHYEPDGAEKIFGSIGKKEIRMIKNRMTKG